MAGQTLPFDRILAKLVEISGGKPSEASSEIQQLHAFLLDLAGRIGEGGDGSGTTVRSNVQTIRDNGDGTWTIVLANGDTFTITAGKGLDGRGIKGITRNTVDGLVIVTFTDGSPPATFPLADGAKGDQGPPGNLDDFWPWTHGILYDDRNENEIPHSSRGVWRTSEKVEECL